MRFLRRKIASLVWWLIAPKFETELELIEQRLNQFLSESTMQLNESCRLRSHQLRIQLLEELRHNDESSE